MPKKQNINLDKIIFDESIQARVEIDSETLEHYAELLGRKVKLPFPDVFAEKDGNYQIGDGWHRILAHKLAGKKTVTCNVHPGGRAAALKMALGANTTHGLRRTNADKRKAVLIGLREYPKMSQRQLAKLCAVSNAMVSKIQAEVLQCNTSKGEKVLTVNTSGEESYTPEQLVMSFKEEFFTFFKTADDMLWSTKTPDPRIQFFKKADFQDMVDYHKDQLARLNDLLKGME